jgi:hypothetical protein
MNRMTRVGWLLNAQSVFAVGCFGVWQNATFAIIAASCCIATAIWWRWGRWL